MKNVKNDKRPLTKIVVALFTGISLGTTTAEEPYQYIRTPGYDPVLYSTNTCSVMASTASPLTTGTLSLPAEPSGLEARFRMWLESLGTCLKSTKFRHFIINFY